MIETRILEYEHLKASEKLSNTENQLFGIKDLSTQFIALGSFAVGLNLWAVFSYRKRN